MLVLTRKVGDVVAIGDDIKIIVMAIKGKQVRLGIQANRSTVVHREEIYQKIQQETRAAFASDLTSTNIADNIMKSVVFKELHNGNNGLSKNNFHVHSSTPKKNDTKTQNVF